MLLILSVRALQVHQKKLVKKTGKCSFALKYSREPSEGPAYPTELQNGYRNSI